ncbi:arrestin domain-containing protein 5-like [Galleria mellonella]|uniref:Arrestin domain-containing protein 5-like n=1 Tax=Galleria mellonella TaxID=7137 RepID=A0ABM3MLH1_GALME|nr:arrestin domain-containing protein 5-like [Galleria mellonella]
MPWKTCSVLLNSASAGNLYAGDIVTGSVILEFDKKRKIENISFQVFGFSKAQWTRPKPTMPYIKIYSEKRKVLHIEMDVFGATFGKIISPDIYNFPFHFALPEDLAATFKSFIGKTFYYIKIQANGRCTSKEIIPFVIQRKDNLNRMAEFLKPLTYTFEKTFWNSGAISLSFKTFIGFGSNQTVPFEIVFYNEKKVKIREVNILLIQKRHYSIKEAFADEEKVVCKTEYKTLLSKKHEKIKLSMDVPCLTPSSIKTMDHVINISYVLRVEVVFLFHFTWSEEVPVTLASVPVNHYDFDT